MSTEYTHFAKLAFDKLFAIGIDGSETVLFNSSGLFIGSIGSLSSLILASGTVASPSLKLGGLTTGLYSAASNTVDIAASGIQVFNFSSSAIARVRLQIQNGTVASPGLNFQNDPDTGIYNAAAGVIGVSTGGTQRLNISSAGVIGLSVFQGPNGTVSSPSFGFQNDPTSGIYRISSGTIGITTAGVLAATLSGSGLALVKTLALGGSAISTSSILNNSPTAVQNPLSGVTQRASRTSMTGTSAATTEVVGFSSAVSTEAVSFTTALRTHFQSANQAKGAGSTITRDLGFGGSIPTQGTNNALLADNTAFTGDWVINSTSTSPSLFSGPMEWKQQATPSNPASGNNRIYFKSDGNLYKLTSAGVETAFSATTGDINQGGNSFGTTMTIGTNDAFTLAFETNGVTNGSVTSAGAWTLGATGFTGTHTFNANVVRILPGSGVDSTIAAKADNAGSLALAGASGAANGGVIILNGNSHASKANIIEFQTAASGRGTISAAGLWTIGTAAGTQAHVVNGSLEVSSDLKVTTAGKGLFVKEGSNAKMGVSTLVAGTVTVATTAVTASSRIFLTSQSDGGTPGFQRITTRTALTSFVITSSNGADTSVIAWMIVEPA